MTEETRITADSPPEAVTRICLTPLPKEEAIQPKPSRQFWKWNFAGWFVARSLGIQPKPEHQFWKWFRWMWFILFLATVSINVATFRQQARNRQSLIEIQQYQAEIQQNQAKIDELKKEANRLKQELEERK